jgi:PAS domain S-box-containing protein
MQDEERKSAYRRKAEQIVDKQQLQRHQTEETLIYELKVHQIELEMQNAELQTSQEELQRSRRQYEMLFEYAPVAYFVLNQEGGIEEVNQVGASMLLAERKHLSLKPFIVFLPREYHVTFFEHLKKVFRNGGADRVELQLLDRDGGSRWVRLESRRQLNPRGREQCLTAITDISEARQTREDLVEAKSEAIRAAETEPVSERAMLYEARTPVDGIRFAAEQLLAANPTGHHRRSLEAIRDAAAAVVATLRELSDEGLPGEENRSRERFNPRRTLRALRPLFLPSLESRGNELSIEVDTKVEESYLGDPRRIRQVLVALLSNANNVSEEGRITVRARESRLSEELVELTFAVEDSGRGIPPQKQREIFRQPGKGKEASHGLSIARQLVRRMGGQIYFESSPGRGTTFYVSLPLRIPRPRTSPTEGDPGEPQPAAAGSAALGAGDTGGREEGNESYSVLVAEDNSINVLVLKTLLERAGYKVVCVENGREAVDKLKSYPFDLVLMDISMPILDGVKATMEIRSGESGALDSRVPILAVTAHSMKGDREKFLAAGMDDYVSKPFDKEVVMRKVYQLVRSRRDS